jgi:hypothetical protein
MIRDDAAGGLRVPGPAITSSQTIHKTRRAEGSKTPEKRVERYLWSAWLREGGRSAGVAIAAAVTTKVLSKLFSRASRRVEGPGKWCPIWTRDVQVVLRAPER